MSETEKLWHTEYGVQTFVVERRRLKGEERRPARSADHARRLCKRLAEIRAGAIAFSRRMAPELGEYEMPRILETSGSVPDDLEQRLAS